MFLLKNKTGFDIEFEGVTVQPDTEIELQELPALKDVICYNDADCNLNYSNGYKTHDNVHVLEIYIGWGD